MVQFQQGAGETVLTLKSAQVNLRKHQILFFVAFLFLVLSPLLSGQGQNKISSQSLAFLSAPHFLTRARTNYAVPAFLFDADSGKKGLTSASVYSVPETLSTA